MADWQHRINDLLTKASRLDPRAVVTVSRRSLTDIAPGRTARAITAWSRKSRSAMCRTFAELDYTPLVQSAPDTSGNWNFSAGAHPTSTSG
ncbi:Uncharacterised protein [Mycobacteroides abscessus subsp. abscessus]|nr:Uncharacterised protein [Mycobacteroides abscessus subsp. abscessus]